MSLEDLERDGILLPREQWGQTDQHTTVNKPALLALAAAGVVSAALMFWGNGTLWTWLGLGLFLVSFFAFTGMSLHAIQRQSRRRSSRDEA